MMVLAGELSGHRRHQAAAKAIEAAIDTHLDQVPDLDQEISPIYHAAKAFAEKAQIPVAVTSLGGSSRPISTNSTRPQSPSA